MGSVYTKCQAISAGPFAKVKPWNSLRAKERAWESRAMEAYAGMVDDIVKFLS